MVVGGGAMGSSTAWWLARRGADVTLLEQFERGHDRGSSHGTVRIFRLAYADDLYVKMALAAEPLWIELEGEADDDLLERTGALDHGIAPRIHAVSDALTRHGVRHELLEPTRRRSAGRASGSRGRPCSSRDGGVVFADRTVRAAQDVAIAQGAEVSFNEPARAIHLRRRRRRRRDRSSRAAGRRRRRRGGGLGGAGDRRPGGVAGAAGHRRAARLVRAAQPGARSCRRSSTTAKTAGRR